MKAKTPSKGGWKGQVGEMTVVSMRAYLPYLDVPYQGLGTSP